jgi:putative transcriptional regulator
MIASHHPGHGWLLDYACGHLSPAFDLVLATHLLGCGACRDNLRVAETFGGDVLGNAPRIAPTFSADDVMDATREIDGPPANRPSTALPPGADLTGVVAATLRVSWSALRWRAAGQGLAIAKLAAGGHDKLWLLRAAPGRVLPRHSHHGSELTLVLQGAYFNGAQVFAAGDVEDADESTEHQPVVALQGECICLAATSAPLRFRDWLPRLAQPLLGI